jgi:hypothetical protein
MANRKANGMATRDTTSAAQYVPRPRVVAVAVARWPMHLRISIRKAFIGLNPRYCGAPLLISSSHYLSFSKHSAAAQCAVSVPLRIIGYAWELTRRLRP